jgi:hypothetical protein
MEALQQIQTAIASFAGYGNVDQRRVSDEQVRAYVGERLALLPQPEIDRLDAQERGRYDRALLRVEFVNLHGFDDFNLAASPQRIDAVARADAAVLTAANALMTAEAGNLGAALALLEAALDARDAAMEVH